MSEQLQMQAKATDDLKAIIEGTAVKHLPSLLKGVTDIEMPPPKQKLKSGEEDTAKRFQTAVGKRLQSKHRDNHIPYNILVQKCNLP